ncbi:MAG: DUF2079 domain-containing protein [Anaerolineae bacterium]
MALIFFSVISWMTFRQYAVFHLQAPDVVLFTNSMWHTLRGDILYSTVTGFSALAFHFTPIFILLSPALLIWEDPRVFFLLQTAALAATGVILWLIARKATPRWALLLTGVFFLNPTLHEVSINELRRITWATPFIALALYGLYFRKNKPLLIGLFFALLAKEDVGIIIFAVGLFVMLIQRNWKLGAFLALFGLISFSLLTFCLIPSLHPDQSIFGFGCYPEAYPQLKYFASFGTDGAEAVSAASESPVWDVVVSILSSPGKVLTTIFDASGRQAVFRILFPIALLLPLIGWEWMLIGIPSVALMMLSSTFQLHTLRDWYMAPILPIMMMATIIGVKRIPDKWQSWAMAGLVACTLTGYVWYSYLPGGRLFLPVRYELTEHHRLAHELISTIPDDAAVMAQDAFTQHLSMRAELHHVRWNSWNEKPFDYLVLDRNLKHYPFETPAINSIIDERIADPNLVISAEADGLFLFQANSEPHPAKQLNATADGGMFLEKAEIAVADSQGIFKPNLDDELPELTAGDTLRVTLYWQALSPITRNRTVSARLSAADGWLIAQHDSIPSNGNRPTLEWETGWYFRDVYYLTIPAGTPAQTADLSILLYDSSTIEQVPFDSGEQINLTTATIEESQ